MLIKLLLLLLQVLFGSFFFIHIFAIHLIFFTLYVFIINQGDIISSYHTDLINFAQFCDIIGITSAVVSRQINSKQENRNNFVNVLIHHSILIRNC